MKYLLLSVLGLALAVPVVEAKLNVVATTADLGAIAKEIGGDKIELTTLGKPTEDPHFVDAKPSFIVKLNHADVVVEGGAELEIGWLPALLDQARNSKVATGAPGHISCATGVPLMDVPATLDRSRGDIHAAGNPHYIVAPSNAKIVAQNIADGLAANDPKSADVYRANLKKFDDAIDAKLVEWHKILAPFQGQSVVAYHDSWPYFAREFGLKIDLFLEPKPGIPPSASHLAEVVTTMKSEGVKLIIVEPFHDRHYAETVAKHTDAAIVDVSSYPGAKGAGDNYIDWMDHLVQSLVKAFESKK